MTVPKPLSTYLCWFSLRAGALITGLTVAAVFATCGAGGVVLLATWNNASHTAILDMMGSDPLTNRNDLVERVYPEGLGAATVVSVVYAASAVLLAYGACRRVVAFVKVFIVASVVVVVMCLIGHLYVFLEFTWHRTPPGLLVGAVVVNSVWYIWWCYSFLVVLSYLVDMKSPEDSSVVVATSSTT
jgi:hypothetical protein